jgi:hypothetical protein
MSEGSKTDVTEIGGLEWDHACGLFHDSKCGMRKTDKSLLIFGCIFVLSLLFSTISFLLLSHFDMNLIWG